MSRSNPTTSTSTSPPSSSKQQQQQQQQPTPTCTKRLLTELKTHLSSPSPALVSLGPVTESDILHWTTVLRGPEGTAYAGGLWALDIRIPPTYPHAPPLLTFLTPICHPNVSFPRGEICLDLLKHGDGAGGSSSGGGGGGKWSPAYTITKCLEAVQMLIAYPEVDSPLNVDVARLLKGGDRIGGESLVRFWCAEFRWRGE